MPLGASASKRRAPKFARANMANDIVLALMKVGEKLFIFAKSIGTAVWPPFCMALKHTITNVFIYCDF